MPIKSLVCFEQRSSKVVCEKMLNIFKLLMLATVAAATVVKAEQKLVNTKQVVRLELDLPWYITFSVPKTESFEPLSLEAKIKYQSDHSVSEIALTSVDTKHRQIFRNKEPLNLTQHDIISASLTYSNNGAKKQPISFDYAIKNKQFDVVYLDVELLMNTSTLEADDIDYEDPVNAVAFQPPSSQAAPAAALPRAPEAMSTSGHIDPAALLQTALDQCNIGKRLILMGSQPPGTNAVDAIRSLITDKLRLPHLAQSILQAQFTNLGLIFELTTAREKLEVLTQASMLLKKSPYTIVSTERDFLDVALYQRGDLIN